MAPGASEIKTFGRKSAIITIEKCGSMNLLLSGLDWISLHIRVGKCGSTNLYIEHKVVPNRDPL